MTAVGIRKYKVFKELKKPSSPHGAGMGPIQKAQNPAGTATNRNRYTAGKNLCFAQIRPDSLALLPLLSGSVDSAPS